MTNPKLPLHTVERPTLLRFRPQVADVMHARAEMYAARAHEQAKAAEVFGEGTVKPKTDPTSRPLDPTVSSLHGQRKYASEHGPASGMTARGRRHAFLPERAQFSFGSGGTPAYLLRLVQRKAHGEYTLEHGFCYFRLL